jgi:hypothetical protein
MTYVVSGFSRTVITTINAELAETAEIKDTKDTKPTTDTKKAGRDPGPRRSNAY